MITFFVGKRLFDRKAGFFAALVLLTSIEFFWLGRRGNIDMTLALGHAGAYFFLVRIERRKKNTCFLSHPICVYGDRGFD